MSLKVKGLLAVWTALVLGMSLVLHQPSIILLPMTAVTLLHIRTGLCHPTIFVLKAFVSSHFKTIQHLMKYTVPFSKVNNYKQS